MPPTACPNCKSEKLTLGGLRARFQPGFRLLGDVPLYGAACLECGAVTPYLDNQNLAKVRQSETESR